MPDSLVLKKAADLQEPSAAPSPSEEMMASFKDDMLRALKPPRSTTFTRCTAEEQTQIEDSTPLIFQRAPWPEAYRIVPVASRLAMVALLNSSIGSAILSELVPLTEKIQD